MRLELLALTMLLVPTAVPAATDALPELAWTVRVDSVDALRDELWRRTSEHLAPLGFHVSRAGARVATSRPIEFGHEMRIRLQAQVVGGAPMMPFAFAVVESRAPSAPVTAWLSGRVQREVRVMRRSVRRGEVVGCDDSEVALRDLDRIPAQVLQPQCMFDAEQVAARDLGKGDVVRANDVGPAPMVAAQADVRLLVRIGGVVVERPGRALGAAARGETVLVRIDGTSRSVKGAVVAHNVVEVMEDRP